METLIRLPEVERRTGLKRSALYFRIERNEFPAPVRLTAKAVAWIETEIDAWISDRIAASREGRA